MYDEFFSKANELTKAGVPFATATVVRADAPTSGKPGDKAIITVEGAMLGWIGGSCASPTVIKEALTALEKDESRLIRLSTDEVGDIREGIIDLPMTCFSGGTLEIYIEAHHPRPRLLIIGDLPVAQSLGWLGRAMNYHVIAVDPDNSGAMTHADEVVLDLNQIPSHVRPNTYCVVATHGNFDEIGLTKLMGASPAYVGLVASPKRAESVRNYLKASGFNEEDLLALKAPAGLDIQARRGDEIALSIMAEIVQKRRNAEQISLELFQPQPQSISLDMLEPVVSANSSTDSENRAIDPICLMTVDTATAHFTSEYNSEIYYFCCAGCKTKFEKTPAEFIPLN